LIGGRSSEGPGDEVVLEDWNEAMTLSDVGGDSAFGASSSSRKKWTQEVQNEAWVVDQKHNGRALDVLNRL
jgi:hypothetical protein